MKEFFVNYDKKVWDARDAFNASAAQMAANGADDLQGNSIPIPIDAWRSIDSRAQAVAKNRLVVFDRLMRASAIPVSVSDLVNMYPKTSDNGEAVFSMDGQHAGKEDQAVVDYAGTPVPIISDHVGMGWRQMAVDMKAGGLINNTSITNSQYVVTNALEDMVINGKSSIVVGGSTIYGLRTFPDRSTFTHGLTLASATGAQWLTAFKSALSALLTDKNYGQVTIFVNQADYLAASTTDYSASYSGTILSRLMTIPGIKEIIPAPSVPANEILGVADLDTGLWGGILMAMPMATRPLARHNMRDKYVFETVAAAAPQLRSDASGQSAFVHGTTA